MAPSDTSSSRHSLQRRCTEAIALLVVALLSFIPCITGASSYTSIFSFGDSIADTGNWYFSSQPPTSCHCFFPPNGQTYFRRPTGRCSDGRLIIDFIAESLGVPLVKPYLGIKNGQFNDWKIEEGVNFAVIGATALDVDFFEEKGIRNVPTNDSLRIQFGWLKDLLPSLCNSSSSKLLVTRKFDSGSKRIKCISYFLILSLVNSMQIICRSILNCSIHSFTGHCMN